MNSHLEAVKMSAGCRITKGEGEMIMYDQCSDLVCGGFLCWAPTAKGDTLY